MDRGVFGTLTSIPAQDSGKFRGGQDLTPPYTFFTENNLCNNGSLFSVKEVALFIFEIVREVKPLDIDIN